MDAISAGSKEDEFVPLDAFTAASIGDVDSLKCLLNDGKLDVSATNRGGWTALMYAAYVGHEKVCRFLIECHANVDARGPFGQTPLMLAASCDNENVCNLLLQNGADIKARDQQGSTCLVHAANCNHTHLVKYFLRRGADPNQILNAVGDTPFLIVCSDGNELIIQSYLEHGADINYANKNGDSPRKLALRYNNRQIHKLLENHRAINDKKAHKPLEKTSSNPSTNSRLNSVPIADGRFTLEKFMNTKFLLASKPESFSHCNLERPNCAPPPPVKRSPSATVNHTPATAVTISNNKTLGGKIDNGNGSRQQNQQTNGGSQILRPKTLSELFEQLQLTKYLACFEQNEIDLTLFLQMTDPELKEIGIKLFGPRKKMLNAIARWHQHAPKLDSVEGAYANYYRALSEEYCRKNTELNTELTATQELVEKYKQEVHRVENNLVSVFASARLCNSYVKECKKHAQIISDSLRRNDTRSAEQHVARVCALCDQTLLKFAEGGLL